MNKTKEIKEYFESPAISQSFLKGVLSNEKEKKTTKGMRAGTLLDVLTTSPESFNDLYKIADVNLSDTVETIFKELISKNIELNSNNTYEILEICKQNDYYGGKTRAFNELMKLEMSFYQLKETKGFAIISQNKYDSELSIATELKKWVDFKTGTCQVPLFAQLDGFLTKDVDCKGLLDYFSLPDEAIIDVKRTAMPLKEFSYEARKYGYALQGAFYSDLVTNLYDFIPSYGWLVYSDYDKKVAFFKSDESDLDVGRYGKDWVKGYKEAIDIYQYCTENNLPDWDMEYYKSSGIYNLRIYR